MTERKWIKWVLLLALIIPLVMVACGGQEQATEEPTTAPAAEEETAEEPTEEPMEEPTEEPMEEPTEEPMEEPTEEPMEEPEAEEGGEETPRVRRFRPPAGCHSRGHPGPPRQHRPGS